MTPNQITMLIILIAYMAVVLAVGLYASRRVKGSEDFLLAGRSMGLFVLVGTLCATQLGGGNIIGTSTNGYNQGLSGMTFGVSTGLAMLVLGLLMAKPMRKMGLCTISDFVYNRYQSNTARVLTSVFSFAALFGILAAQVGAISKVLTVFGINTTVAAVIAICIRETRTSEIMKDVCASRSELGIIYLSKSNEAYMKKRLKNDNLEFHYLFECSIYAYLWHEHQLAHKPSISYQELQQYPYLIFEQGENSVSFLSEETESKYTFPDVIRTNDRATMMELIRQIHAFTICCGIMDDVYKKQGFIAVPIDTDETMKIGYVTLKNAKLSPVSEEYVRQLKVFGQNSNV